MLGKSEVWMSNSVRQPFFQERVDSILRERNRDALESMFKIQRFSNPATLVELSDGPVDARTVRARACFDRLLGKKKPRLCSRVSRFRLSWFDEPYSKRQERRNDMSPLNASEPTFDMTT